MTKSYTIPTQGKKNEMERLVRDIAYILSPYAIVWRCDDESCAVCEPRRKEDRERAEIIITRILKAVVDGELKIPGERARYSFASGYVDEVLAALTPALRTGDLLIALRPPEGTGKEEEE